MLMLIGAREIKRIYILMIKVSKLQVSFLFFYRGSFYKK